MLRLSTWLVVGGIALLGPQPHQAFAQAVEQVTVEQAAARIRQAEGRKAVIVFYKTNCPLSVAAFPGLVALARDSASAGVVFLVFSIDDPKRMPDVPRFLARYNAPFKPVFVRRWAKGTFTKAMAALGIEAGVTFNTALVAVRNSAGTVVAQADGVSSVVGLERVLSAIP